ncbi:Variable outer membrane protein, partial (plasmid) [Borrelia coriaceae ATCC 43381]
MKIKIQSICATLFISLFLSCNNGVIEELQKQRDFILSISNLRQGFLDIFTSFGNMVSDTLSIKADTKKEDIGKCFTNIEETMKTTKEKLKDVLAKNGNYPKVKGEVEKFIEKLGIIEKGAKEAAEGAIGGDAISGATASGQDAVAADVTSVTALVKGIKGIVGVVLKQGEGDPTATKTKDAQQQTIGKLFSEKKSNGGTEVQAAAASASIGAISGTDILRAIAMSGDVTIGGVAINEVKDAANIAAGKTDSAQDLTVGSAKKDAVIAAGIALRAMAKGGKFAK